MQPARLSKGDGADSNSPARRRRKAKRVADAAADYKNAADMAANAEATGGLTTFARRLANARKRKLKEAQNDA